MTQQKRIPKMGNPMPEITREQMVHLLRELREGYRLNYENPTNSSWVREPAQERIQIIDAVLAALEPKKIVREDIRSLIDTLDFLRVEAAQYRMETVDDLPSEYLKNIKKIEDCILLAALAGPEPMTEKSWMKLSEELNVPFSAVKIIRDKLYTEKEGPGVKEVLVDELQEDDLIPLTSGGLKSLKNPPAALGGPGAEERKEMLYLWENLGKLFVPGVLEREKKQLRDFPLFQKIRTLIMGKGAGE